MPKIIYNYDKLLGRIKEKGFTQASLAQKLSISEASLNAKLGNKSPFKQTEIMAICLWLSIPGIDMEQYFFCSDTLEILKSEVHEC